MSAFPFPDDGREPETWMVSLECQAPLGPDRFLNGRIGENAVDLVKADDPASMSTRWAVIRLTDTVVKFCCMATGPGSRFLDGRAATGKVGLRPLLGAPPSGEWWEFEEIDEDVVTLKCLGRALDPRFLFLQGRADRTVALAPDLTPPRWTVRRHGRIVALECQATDPTGRQFLDGDTVANTFQFCPAPMGLYSGSRWLLHDTGNAVVTLKSLGEAPAGVRFLNGLTDGRIDLAPSSGSSFPRTRWQMIPVPNPHADVERGIFASFRCEAAIGERLQFLSGRVPPPGQRGGSIELAHTLEDPLRRTLWRVLPATPYLEPCPRFRQVQDASQGVRVEGTTWVGQITGGVETAARPLLNPDSTTFGVPGVDLGANARTPEGRLFFFFGDVVRGDRPDGPVVDADLVAFTDDDAVTELDDPGGGGIRLTPVKADGFFDPFSVTGPNGIGITGTVEVPSGAYFHDGQANVFFHIWKDPARTPPPIVGCYVAAKRRPDQAGAYREVLRFSPRPRHDRPGLGPDAFAGVAPVKVINADHGWLPTDAAFTSEEGLVMFGIGFNESLGYTAVHLAWMPLIGTDPDINLVRYLTAHGWDTAAEAARPLTGKRPNLQSISAAFLPGPRKWIFLHMTADASKRMDGPILAWIADTPLEALEPVRLFDPCREHAFGKYMHWPGLDAISDHDPIRQPGEGGPDPAVPGWAYGAFLLEPYTRWDPETRLLDLYYLLSLSSPYQVQVMRTTLHID